MKAYIRELGVVDNTGRTHAVSLKEGLNVITGKSSTGKSALIEIFDYCFGSTEYTVPKGVITNSAAIYYVVISVNDQDIVLGRSPEKDKSAFYKREDAFESQKINLDYFLATYFRPLDDFKDHIRSLFLD